LKITFLGATGTVTGSKYLVETEHRRILIDCGLFQGFKQLRLRNWEPLPIDPGSIDVVVLTHAHIDHSGYLPLLVRNGFRGQAICTPGTRDLCGILLPDSAFLQEQDADFANRYGFSKHHPALPLYTQADAELALTRLRTVNYGVPHDLGGGISLTFRNAGHIVGAAMAILTDGKTTVTFSGDLGRPNDPIMRRPEPLADTDYLVVESTYGDRTHDAHDPADLLAGIITRTAARGGTVLIPAFAVGRAQTLLYLIRQLKNAGKIPNLPVFLDSPMAIDASEILYAHQKDHRLSAGDCHSLQGVAREVRSAEESQALDRGHVPAIIISASGMATGGRVIHHLKVFAPDPRNTVLFTGFQAGGTRGAAMVGGAKQVKIHGEYVPIRADVTNLDMLSAHADANEILAWLKTIKTPPRTVFITHGEPLAADALRLRIEEELHWTCRVPAYRDEADLT
jgi:metallo-beta-lactamase family protein